MHFTNTYKNELTTCLKRLLQVHVVILVCYRVKSGNVGHHVNLDSDLVCFIF